jgi:hypothetical protein
MEEDVTNERLWLLSDWPVDLDTLDHGADHVTASWRGCLWLVGLRSWTIAYIRPCGVRKCITEYLAAMPGVVALKSHDDRCPSPTSCPCADGILNLGGWA